MFLIAGSDDLGATPQEQLRTFPYGIHALDCVILRLLLAAQECVEYRPRKGLQRRDLRSLVSARYRAQNKAGFGHPLALVTPARVGHIDAGSADAKQQAAPRPR